MPSLVPSDASRGNCGPLPHQHQEIGLTAAPRPCTPITRVPKQRCSFKVAYLGYRSSYLGGWSRKMTSLSESGKGSKILFPSPRHWGRSSTLPGSSPNAGKKNPTLIENFCNHQDIYTPLYFPLIRAQMLAYKISCHRKTFISCPGSDSTLPSF